MSNHTHQVLRSRPDVAKEWTDEEVVRRWLRITPKYDRAGNLKPPNEQRVRSLVKDKRKVEVYRRRLSHISWWMRYFAQNIAVRCNREDGMTGHFWEARFGHSLLSDDPDILACMLYVDLNPVRAKLANSPEECDYTSAKDRIDDLRIALLEDEEERVLTQMKISSDIRWERLGAGEHAGWLTPIQIDERCDPPGADLQDERHPDSHSVHPVPAATECEQKKTDRAARRCSRKGILRGSLECYLALLETLSQCLQGSSTPASRRHLKATLRRMNIAPTDFDQALMKNRRRTRHPEPLLPFASNNRIRTLGSATVESSNSQVAQFG